jgi:hypothetical protein
LGSGNGVEGIFEIGEDGAAEIDILGDDYLANIEKAEVVRKTFTKLME